MKIKDIVEIINKNAEFTTNIVTCKNKLSNLNYLDMNGELTPFAQKEKELRGIEETLLDYDKKIVKHFKPLLDKEIEEYKQWLEMEI